MHREYFKLIPAVHLLLVQDDKILLLRRFNTGYEDGNYSVPAGHVDGGEPATSAMVREAKEEVGIIVQPNHLSLAHVMHRITERESIDFFFTASIWEGTPINCEPEKCDDLSWFSINALPGNTIPYIKNVIDHWQHKRVFSEFGWNL